MLSYMLPVEEKSPTSRNLSLNLNLANNNNITTSNNNNNNLNNNNNIDDNDNINDDLIDENTKLLNGERNDYVINGVLKNGGTEHHHNNHHQNYHNGQTQSQSQNHHNNSSHHHNSILSNGSSDLSSNGILLENGHQTSSCIVNATTTNGDTKKIKMNKLGNKNVTLKRVSFGSSKGSMVETLVFETPTPLPEHAEREFGFSTDVVSSNNLNISGSSSIDDSGIELQEEVERSKVRVSFFESSQPQSISPPADTNLVYFGDNNNLLLDTSITSSIFLHDTSYLTSEDTMSAAVAQIPASYDRQISTESGWDNPFRPGGDLSREADEIVSLIKGGKPITPTGNQTFLNGNTPKDSHVTENGTTVIDGATKLESSQLQTSLNGTKSPQKTDKLNGDKNGTATSTGTTNPSQTQISNQVVPGPLSASHVVIDDKKKKKCTCCVIQ